MNLNFVIKFDKFLERLWIKFTNRESYFNTLPHDPVMYLESSQTTMKVLEQLPSGQGAGFPIQASRIQNDRVAPRLTQPFILPRSVK